MELELQNKLAKDGFIVVVLDLTEEACFSTVDSIIKNDGDAISIGADVVDESQIKTVMGKIISKIGAPGILVNNAGFARDVYVDLMGTKDWDDVINVHLRGTFLMVKESLSYMKKSSWG